MEAKLFSEKMLSLNTNTSIMAYNLLDDFIDVRKIEEYEEIVKNEKIKRYSIFMDDLVIDVKDDRGVIIVKEVRANCKKEKNILELYAKKNDLAKICIRGKELLMTNENLIKKLSKKTTYHPNWDMKYKMDGLTWDEVVEVIYEVVNRDKGSTTTSNAIVKKGHIINSTKRKEKGEE